jgi:hypothetical protein
MISLAEFDSLPSTKYFAEYFFGHSAKKLSLLSATQKTSVKKHSAKKLLL